MAKTDEGNDIKAKRRISEALAVLRELDFPKEQQNERSALTLLALLDLKPNESWTDARNPLCGITPMMEFFADKYGKRYAPNSRETVRRFTVHQFNQAGLVVLNPDDPDRPTNSPRAVYQIEPRALKLLRTYGSKEWASNLKSYRSSIKSLREKYAGERERSNVSIEVGGKIIVKLSPGGQNLLIKKIVEDFMPVFVRSPEIIYIGDTGAKFSYFKEETLRRLGVDIEPHGKMPDVIIYDRERNWLLLIEAVTSHGPISPKRRDELKALFGTSSAGVVYVTAFIDRHSMLSYFKDISWETEVWVAESPSHMIHFNGERFLGPYD